jgi:hypothetical protein
MSASMTTKKAINCCAYRFVQGEKKGKMCHANCRGDFCFRHRPKNIAKKAQWFQKQNNNHDQFMDNIEIIDELADLPNF